MSLNNIRSSSESTSENPSKKLKLESTDISSSSSSSSTSSSQIPFSHFYSTSGYGGMYDISLPISTPIPSYATQGFSSSTPFLSTMQPTPQLSYPSNYTQSSNSLPNTTHLSAVTSPASSSSYSASINTTPLSKSNSKSNLSTLGESPHNSCSSPNNSLENHKSQSAYIYSILHSLKREDFEAESETLTTTSSISPSTSPSNPNINKKIEELISNIIFEIGLKNSSPKILIPLIPSSPSGLSTEHIKSHLQKYRKHKNRYQEDFHNLFHNHIKLSFDDNLKKFNNYDKIHDYLLKKINTNSTTSSTSGSVSDKKNDNQDSSKKKDDDPESNKDEVKNKLSQLMNLQKLLLDSSSLLTDWKSIVRDVADRGDRINREILTLLAEPDELECLR